MQIAIFGVGALACLFGARLSQLEFQDLVLLGTWPEQISALQTGSLVLQELDGCESPYSLWAQAKLDNIPPVDVGIVLVKSQQTERVAKQATRLLKANGLLLTLQNGLGNAEILAEQVGSARVAVGVTAQGATVLGPGHVRHAGQGATHLAHHPQNNKRLLEIAQLFQQAGLETQISQESDGLIWGKLAVNAGINPLTALFEVPNGRLAEDDRLRQLMIDAAQEVAQLAQVQGIVLPYPDVRQHVVAVAQATATNRSSMWQDMARGAPTEIESICGAVVRLGTKLGVSTPRNAQFLHLIRAKSAGQAVDLANL